jgi:hypothetical protein
VTEPASPWRVEFYESTDGRCPVPAFLDGLGEPARAKVVALIRLLAEQGPTLPFPYSSHVRGKIRELRTQYGKENLRVLYFGAPGREWVLVHAFSKRIRRTLEQDIRLAEARMTDHLNRRKRTD